MPKFLELPFPYSDCAFISFKDATLAAQGAQQIRPFFAEHDLVVHVLTPSSPSCVAIYSKHSRLIQRADRFHLFSGFGRIGSQFVFGDRDIGSLIKRSDISGEIGQFTYFTVDGENVLAETDLLGHGHLFESQHENFAVISNRLHLHTLVLVAFGHKLELNKSAALSMLFSGNVFFSQQNMSHDMLTEGVNLVPVDKRASLKHGMLTWREKASLKYAITGAPLDYEYLIEEGAREVLENARAAIESPEFGEVIVDLSGGKDSRLVFGAALHAQGWQERIALNSSDVRNSQDLPIACGIANHFGAKFYRGDSLPRTPLSAEENVQMWRSYFQGLYHRMGASAWTYEGRNTDSISLSGGSGEILRTFWHENLRQHVRDGDTLDSFASRFAKNLGKERGFGDDRAEVVGKHLASVLRELPGKELGNKLESHYLYFRNRSHFGLRGFSFYHERPTWFPLMSASLLKAAHSIPFFERAQGRVIRDVMARINPVLLGMPFDGKGIERNAAKPVTLNTDRSAWEAATKERETRRIASFAGHKATMIWGQWPDYVRDEAIRAHEEALSMSSTYRDMMPASYIDLLRHEFATKSRHSMTMASALFAVRDSIS